MHRKDSLRYLLLMAAVDGRLDREELMLLTDRALLWGVTDDEFEAILDEASAGTTELLLPITHDEKMRTLVSMIDMMAADGHVTDQEKLLFAKLAIHMNISNTQVEEIIDTALCRRSKDTA
jgi:hypothetical protein